MESLAQVRIGTAGWSYKDWDGIFYPSGLEHRKQHQLEYLARFFYATEINTSFYGPLKPEWAKFWCRKFSAVDPAVLFTVHSYPGSSHSPITPTNSPPPASIPPSTSHQKSTTPTLT